eukprot:CAMPEP_0204608698 /NCGR_PEP_ID=MMETSP0661-20131031/60472_1 /ASSEMBLY_ACC=CAM_ASM_000606 /TAXON_ID=109239 /ORGANISM="Alexandrium margalefi, Strain AMGDE01CS-322" /LENGTH=138 /DNA_ID=CAMNT_0051620253 /DNA_START=98 /DNA_END=511 /DNA_ORIENTATION=-
MTAGPLENYLQYVLGSASRLLQLWAWRRRRQQGRGGPSNHPHAGIPAQPGCLIQAWSHKACPPGLLRPLASKLGGGGGARLHGLHVPDVRGREVARGAAAGDAAEDDAVQQGVAAQAVVPVDAARGLARREEAADDLV